MITILIVNRSINTNNGVIRCEYLFFTKELILIYISNYSRIKVGDFEHLNLRIILKFNLSQSYKFLQGNLYFF